MADWRKVAMAAILSDGKIDEAECKVLKKELWNDGKIDDDEVKFLLELRESALRKARAKKEDLTEPFNKLFFSAIRENTMKDNKLDASSVKYLRETLFADGRIDAKRLEFLQELDKKAKEKDAGFTTMLEELKTKHEKATKKSSPK